MHSFKNPGIASRDRVGSTDTFINIQNNCRCFLPSRLFPISDPAADKYPHGGTIGSRVSLDRLPFEARRLIRHFQAESLPAGTYTLIPKASHNIWEIRNFVKKFGIMTENAGLNGT